MFDDIEPRAPDVPTLATWRPRIPTGHRCRAADLPKLPVPIEFVRLAERFVAARASHVGPSAQAKVASDWAPAFAAAYAWGPSERVNDSRINPTARLSLDDLERVVAWMEDPFSRIGSQKPDHPTRFVGNDVYKLWRCLGWMSEVAPEPTRPMTQEEEQRALLREYCG